MTDVFLGVIAAAVLVMAVVEVTAMVFAVRAARRVDRLADRLEQDIRPMMASLQALTADAARVTALAAAQVEHLLSSLNALLAVFRDSKAASRQRPAGVDDDDALFIG